MKWHSIERSTFKKDRVVCNQYNFQYIAQSTAFEEMSAHISQPAVVPG